MYIKDEKNLNRHREEQFFHLFYIKILLYSD